MTTIYVLFREYADQSHKPSKEYINGEEFILDDGRCIDDEFSKVMHIVEFFDYEHAYRLYDRDNLNGLLHQFNVLEDEYPGREVVILSQLKLLGLTDWEDLKVESEDNVKFVQYDITNHMLGDLAHREMHEGHCVLLNVDAIDCSEQGLKFNSHFGELEIPIAKNIRQLHHWLSENRFPQRRYDYNSKHGDAKNRSRLYVDRHGIHQAAQLETTKDETCVLLKLAVGRNRESELWYWDIERKKFIYFENQHTQNPPSFHAYHLVGGQNNYENIDIEKLKQVQDF